MGAMTIAPRMVFWASLALLTSLLLAPGSPAATLFDPDTRWHTLVTPHFRVNYPAGLEDVAVKAGGFAEDAHAKLVGWMKTVPTQPTELTLLDNEDTANGFAFPYPNNQIFLYVTAARPDMHEQIRSDSWLKTNITHEYAHVLHLETTGGLVAALDKVFGRVFFPNLAPGQPLFLVEGLAVMAETDLTSGGRGRESVYDMKLRAAVLDHKVLTLDQAAGYHTSKWPGGQGVYLLGTHFYKYVVARYGRDVPPRVADAYGSEPWFGIDGAFRKVVGRDLYQLWDEYMRWLDARYQVQAAQIAQSPVTPFDLVTRGGRYHRHPLFLPDGRLLYTEYTGHDWVQVRAASPASGSASPRYDTAPGKPLLYKGLFGGMTVTRDGRWLFYSSAHQKDDYHQYQELHRFDFRDQKRARLTTDTRASDPAVSPDGRRVMAVLNHGGRNDLALFDPGGTLLRTLARNQDGTQYADPTWSPDGTEVAVSAWRDGWRDLYLVDPETGAQKALWRDPASDLSPVWTPDGKWLLFSSNRTGVDNLHAVRMADRQVFQITNVLTGAFEPTVSPDMRTLAFTSYSGEGYDIATMSFRPEAWSPARNSYMEASDADGTFVPVTLAAASESQPVFKLVASKVAGRDASASAQLPNSQTVSETSLGLFRTEPYNPWVSLRPKAWVPNVYLPDEAGAGLGITLLGYDTLLQHQIWGTVGLGLAPRRPQYSLAYTNDVLVPTITVSLSDMPGAYPVIEKKESGQVFQTWRRETQTAASLTYPGVPSALLGQLHVTGDYITLQFNRTDSRDLGSEVPSDCGDVPKLFDSPLAATSEVENRCLKEAGGIFNSQAVPVAGVTSVIGLRYRHADHYKFGHSISPEGGSLFALSYDKANPLWGSQATFDRVSMDYRVHTPGFGQHHVGPARPTAGANLGGRGGGFRLGGNVVTLLYDIVDARSLGAFQEVPLRGYPARNGDRVAALNVEYRFPLGEIQRGLGTLPLFLDRWYGVLMYDVGNVWTGDYKPNNLKQALGVQARAKVHVMNVPLEVGAGVAQGTSPLGLAKDIASQDRRLGSWELGSNLLPPPEIMVQIGTSF